MGLYIGLMSGTSADGIDAVVAEFIEGQFKALVGHHCSPIPEGVRSSIFQLYEPGSDEIDRLGQLDVQLGQLFARAAREVLAQCGVSAKQITAIGSHGQTIRHRPRLTTPFTLQIGDANVIASETGITTVADFRRRDIALGGQGAPLAPAFHHACFAHPGERRGVLNIGGIANLTVLDGPTLQCGYDIGPGNGLMDYWIQKQLGRSYDKEGLWAQSGVICQSLLETFSGHAFFDLPPPRSTGREEFSAGWLEEIVSSSGDIGSADIQATLLEFTARSVSKEIERWQLKELYVCGGGAHNTYLMNRLRTLTKGMKLETTDHLGIPVDHVEALTFGWIAHQTLRHASSTNPRVTGAREPAILGGVYWA